MEVSCLTLFELGPEHSGGTFMLFDHAAEKLGRADRAEPLKAKLGDHLLMQAEQLGQHRLGGRSRGKIKRMPRCVHQRENIIVGIVHWRFRLGPNAGALCPSLLKRRL